MSGGRIGPGPHPQRDQPEADRHALAGHTPGGRIAHHEPGPGLRPAADVRPRGPPHPAGGAAFAEDGRIDKTMHLLAPVDDTYRRLMNRQLTVQESVAAWPCDLHGGRGAQGPAHHLPGPLSVQHPGQRPRPRPTPFPRFRDHRGRRGVTANAPGSLCASAARGASTGGGRPLETAA
ncbi:hypothetical protein SCOCK_290018 [Actinacidiphila cocklensis]|uniref:Uncharacterized protein n=1 Tax=Actinacidiphila cocklensis TaxID=887465 RepID=A0A9W4GTI2_9ACTN|nr:hypothetical protein SCOCK_290018 [Actinacidiphila cocklensis]